MSRGGATSLTAYSRAIERLWAERLERAVVLSSRDWTLITDWHGRGVPLQLIREALDALFERRRAAPPRGLWAIADAVDDGWAAIRDGRVADPASGPDDGPGDPVEDWRACRAGLTSDEGPLARLLDELLERARREGPGRALDAWLDERLADAVPDTLLHSARSAADGRLAEFRGRMPEAAWRATRHRAVADRLRRRLGLTRSTGS